MALIQSRPQKKQTGAKYKPFRKRKKYELGSSPRMTKIAPLRKKSIRVLGGNIKTVNLAADIVNLTAKDGKAKKAKIIAVLESSANRHFVRRNIVTKGTIIDTDAGKARITSRPGQEGTINAVLV